MDDFENLFVKSELLTLNRELYEEGQATSICFNERQLNKILKKLSKLLDTEVDWWYNLPEACYYVSVTRRGGRAK
jgi:hypothetical protein